MICLSALSPEQRIEHGVSFSYAQSFRGAGKIETAIAAYAVHVAANCGEVLLDGTESKGTDTTDIVVTHDGGAKASFPVRVWLPEVPVALSVEDAELNAIGDYLEGSPGSCQQAYQSTSWKALTAIVSGSGRTDNVDVSRYVSVESSDTGVAKIANGGHRVVGVGAGRAEIRTAASEAQRMQATLHHLDHFRPHEASATGVFRNQARLNRKARAVDVPST